MPFFIVLFLFPSLIFSVSIAEQPLEETKEEYLPWFTGPLLAGSGKTCPKNHYDLQPNFIVFSSSSFYNTHWKTEHLSTFVTIQPSLLYLFGITNWMDCQVVGSLNTNFCSGKNDTRMSDTSLNFGFQALTDKRDSFEPDLRIVLKQDFPTGHYKNLNPHKESTDASGSGFYKIGVGANFQKIFYLDQRLLRGRFNFTYKISPTTFVEGFSVFGGGFNTSGHIDPTHYFSADIAFEYTLSQNITFAIDCFWEAQSKGNFKGKPGQTKEGKNALVLSPSFQRFSLAPALEYNFSDTAGIIAGSWFTVAGKNTPQFASFAISLNYYH
jgi:hypothetical protein